MASPTTAIVFLLLLISFTAIHAGDFNLQLLWPGGKCYYGGCCFPDTWFLGDTFLLDHFAGEGTSCSQEYTFDVSKVDPILFDLQQLWPSLDCPPNSGEVDWATRWLDDGLCTGFSEFEYFSKAVTLRESVSFSDILESKDIFPSFTNFYTTTDVAAAINEALGGINTTLIHCGADNLSIIRNVILCVDPTGTHFVQCSQTYPRGCADQVQLLPLEWDVVGAVGDGSKPFKPVKTVFSTKHPAEQ